MTSGCSPEERFVLVGTKGGRLYKFAYPVRDLGVDDRYLAEKEEIVIFQDRRCVSPIQRLVFASLPGDSCGVFVGTRGKGVYWIQLGDDIRADRQPLKGSEELEIRDLLYDEPSGTLLAVASEDRLLQWRAPFEESAVVEAVPGPIISLAIDCDPDSTIGDHLYLGTSIGNVYRTTRSSDSNHFDLQSPRHWFSAGGNAFERMLPLSDYVDAKRESSDPRRRLYPERGVVMQSARFLWVVVDVETESGHQTQAIKKSMRDKLLSLSVVDFDDGCVTVSGDVNKALHIVEPTSALGHGDNIAGVFGGRHFEVPVRSRVFAVSTVPRVPGAPIVEGEQRLLAVGNEAHEVCATFMRSPARLTKECIDLRREIRNIGSAAERLGWMRERLQERPYDLSLKKSLLYTLPTIFDRSPDLELPWRDWIYHLAFYLRPDEDLTFKVLRACHHLLEEHPSLRSEILPVLRCLHKFHLNGPSYSDKQDHRLELVVKNKDRNPDDALAYASILTDSGFDPLFRISAKKNDPFGAVHQLVPLLRPLGQPVWWESTQDDPALLLVTTHRDGIWLFDVDGKHALRLRVPAEWGALSCICFVGNWIAFAFDDNIIRRTTRRDLVTRWKATVPEIKTSEASPSEPAENLLENFEVSWSTATAITSCAPLPGHDRSHSQVLVGSLQGTVAILNFEDGSTREVFPSIGGGAKIVDMRTSELVRKQGPSLDYAIIATDDGHVQLLRWNEDQGFRAEDTALVDRCELTGLLWPSPENPTFVVSSIEGQIQSFTVIAKKKGELRLRRGWTFRTNKAIHSIHAFRPAGAPHPFIVVASHDQHLYVLDPHGRLRDSLRLPGTAIHGFAVSPPLPDDEPFDVYGRVFLAGFEDGIHVIRVLNRVACGRVVDSILLGATQGTPTEEDLLRWRGMNIREHYLRRKYYHLTTRFDGVPSILVEEIWRLLDGQDHLPYATDVVHALIERLFRGDTGLDSRSPTPGTGLNRIVQDSGLQVEIAKIFETLRFRWGLPGSFQQVRVLKAWMQTALRCVTSLDLWRRWKEAGSQAARDEGVPYADPDVLLEFFLRHPDLSLQRQTVQEIELLLLGWELMPSQEHRGTPLFAQPDTVRPEDTQRVLDLLLPRLSWKQEEEIHGADAAEVPLQIGRVLIRLIGARLLDPLYLVYEMRRHKISALFQRVLANQLAALNRTLRERISKPQAVTGLFRDASDVLTALQNPTSPRKHITGPMKRVMAYALDPLNSTEASEVYLKEVAEFTENVIHLLSPSGLRSLTSTTVVCGSKGTYYNAEKVFDAFQRFLDAASKYNAARQRDLEDAPFEALQYQDFADLDGRLQDIEKAIGDATLSLAEEVVLKRCLGHWRHAVDHERQQHLLLDFMAILENNVLSQYHPRANQAQPVRTASEVQGLVRHDEGIREIAVRNLFTRLILFGRPNSAVLVNVKRDPVSASITYPILFAPEPCAFNRESEKLFAEVERPEGGGLPHEWWDPNGIEKVYEHEVKQALKVSRPEEEFEVDLIIGRSDDEPTTLGFIALGWKDSESADLERYRRHRLMRSLGLSVLALKQVEIQQMAFAAKFFSMVAHDLRNPLNALRSSSGILIDGHLDQDNDEDRKLFYEHMHRQASHLLSIVNGILTFRGQEMRPQLREISVVKEVDAAIRACRRDIQEHRRSIEFDRKELSHLIVRLDSRWLFQIVENLVSNALKYSPSETPVRVSLDQDHRGGLSLSVSNRGEGIDKSQRRQIFRPFFRLHREPPGIGLGLYICDKYVQTLGGRIQVEDNPGGGTVFKIYFPGVICEEGIEGEEQSEEAGRS